MFSDNGPVKSAFIVYDIETKKSRGFGLVYLLQTPNVHEWKCRGNGLKAETSNAMWQGSECQLKCEGKLGQLPAKLQLLQQQRVLRLVQPCPRSRNRNEQTQTGVWTVGRSW